MRDNEIQARKVFGNGLATVVVVGFVVFILISQLTKWADTNNKIEATKKNLNSYITKLELKDEDTLLTWAKGHLRDAWGNLYILDSDAVAVRLISGGPDQKIGTVDDIKASKTVNYREDRIEEAIAIKTPPDKKKGWSWSFNWGKKSKEK